METKHRGFFQGLLRIVEITMLLMVFVVISSMPNGCNSKADSTFEQTMEELSHED